VLRTGKDAGADVNVSVAAYGSPVGSVSVEPLNTRTYSVVKDQPKHNIVCLACL
jgi:hypothetical protein